jgi:uncharacterized protein (TIGR02421 family)
MKAQKRLSPGQIDTIVQRISESKQVRRSLPTGGRIHIDRALPFLCIYRKPPYRQDEGTNRLIVGEASYLLAEGRRSSATPLARLVFEIATAMAKKFGSFLVVEIWSRPCEVQNDGPQTTPKPKFRVLRTRHPSIFEELLSQLLEELQQIKVLKQKAEASVDAVPKVAPPGMQPVISPKEAGQLNCHLIGLEIEPIYWDSETGQVFPMMLRSLKRQVARVLKHFFYEFCISHTTHSPGHFYALGRRAMVKAVWNIDEKLAEISNSFDFLLQVTPVNAESAWREFKRRRFEKTPVFYYRPRPVDPGMVKRELFDIPIDKVEDPTLMHLFLEKQIELDRKLTMLQDRGTKAFLYGSLQLYGDTSSTVKETALDLVNRLPSRSRKVSKGGYLSAEQFAQRAASEIAFYGAKYPEFKATVQVRDDIYPGLLVSHGHLLIGKDAALPTLRADALLQHEVGTHLLTYYNGKAQPFKMLYSGLPGYDELQEGLAVLSEYLVGGMSSPRIRVLAARVLAGSFLIDGATFLDVFRVLNLEYEFPQRIAFSITMRIFRGGGLTKDAVYLRGLMGVLDYLKKGGNMEHLYVGKIAVKHVPIIEELALRKILNPAPLFPRYLEGSDAASRLARVKEGGSIISLIERSLS